MEIDASDASAAPPTAPQRAKKGGRATNTYNWQTGETIMAVFAALSASEAVSSSEIPQRWQKAGVFYRQYVVELPTWGLWWGGTGPTSVKTPEDSIKVRSDQQIFDRGWDQRGLLDKMTGLYANLWREPEDADDADATFIKERSGQTDVEWWEECEKLAAAQWQRNVVDPDE